MVRYGMVLYGMVPTYVHRAQQGACRGMQDRPSRGSSTRAGQPETRILKSHPNQFDEFSIIEG